MSSGIGVLLDDGTVSVQSRSWKLGSNLSISYNGDGLPQIDAGGAPGLHTLVDTTGLGASHSTSGLTARQVIIATGATTAIFRALVALDLPTHTHTRSQISDLPWTIAQGGTGLTTWSSIGRVLVSTGTGLTATAVDSGAAGGYLRSDGTTWLRAIIPSGDLPSHTHTRSQISDLPWTVGQGGTGLGTHSDEALLVGQGSANISSLQLARGALVTSVSASPPIVASLLTVGGTGRFVRSDGTDISWQFVAWDDVTKTGSDLADLATRTISSTTGTLAVNRGGTNLTSYTQYGILYASGTGVIGDSAAPSGNASIFYSPTGVDPAWFPGGSSDFYLTMNAGATDLQWRALGVGTHALTDHSDVIITSASSGPPAEFLKFTGPNWVDAIIAAADLPTHTHAWADVSKTGSNLNEIVTRAISDTTGTLLSARGGTGLATFAADSVLVSNSANVWAIQTASGGNDLFLRWSTGTGVITWEQSTVGSHGYNDVVHTGTLNVSNGGTGIASFGAQLNSILISGTTGTSAFQQITGGSSTQFLQGNGTDVAPSFEFVTASDVSAGTFGGAFTFSSALTSSVAVGTNIFTFPTSTVSLLRRITTQGGLLFTCDSTMLLHAGDNGTGLVTDLGIVAGSTGETLYLTADSSVRIISNRQTSFAASHEWAFNANASTTMPGTLAWNGGAAINDSSDVLTTAAAVTVAQGGTGLTSIAINSVLVTDAANVLTARAVGTPGADRFLIWDDTLGSIAWSPSSVASHGYNDSVHTGTLDVSNGGTGIASFGAQLNSIIISGSTGTANFAQITGGTSTQFLQGNGTDVAPSFQTIGASDIAAGTFAGVFTFGSRLDIIHAGDEMLRLRDTAAAGSPYLSFYQTSTRRAFIQFNDSGNELRLVSEYGTMGFRTGLSGTERPRMEIGNTGRIRIGTAGTGTTDVAQIYSAIHDWGNRSANTTINLDFANEHEIRCTANIQIGVSNPQAGGWYGIEVSADGSARTPTYTGLNWGDESAPGLIGANSSILIVIHRSAGGTNHAFLSGTGFPGL